MGTSAFLGARLFPQENVFHLDSAKERHLHRSGREKKEKPLFSGSIWGRSLGTADGMADMGCCLQLLGVLRLLLWGLQVAETNGSGSLVIPALPDFLKEILTATPPAAFSEL